jgi:hypothetical protein
MEIAANLADKSEISEHTLTQIYIYMSMFIPYISAKSEVLTEVNMKVTPSWGVEACSLTEMYRYFGVISSIHLNTITYQKTAIFMCISIIT